MFLVLAPLTCQLRNKFSSLIHDAAPTKKVQRFSVKCNADFAEPQLSLMRHANSNITMNIYTHAVSSKKRRALSKVVEIILREEKTTPVAARVA